MHWSREQVLGFAPDAPTARRGKELAAKQKWRLLEVNGNALWGECKSSSSKYYQTQVHLTGPAFKCNCPSRKYPCKHSLGLLLIYLDAKENFRHNDIAPEWANEWLEKRLKKTETSEEEADGQKAPISKSPINASIKNREKRLRLMASGLDDLEQWLMDLIRQGLASTERQPLSYWQNLSARMVDSQLGGLGKKLKALPLLQGTNTHWPARMLHEIAQFYLIIKGFKQLDILPKALQAELLSVAGINTKKDELQPLQGVGDEWKVLGILEGIEDNLNFRRSWLYGLQTNQTALILEYSFGEAVFDPVLFFGAVIKAELVYYPSSYPMRAILKEPTVQIDLPELPAGYEHFESFFEHYAETLSQNPWIYHFPVLLEEVVPVMEQTALVLIDRRKMKIDVSQRDNNGWKLMALSGGGPISVFGEWTGELLIPLSAIVSGRLIKL